jgi:hypothetical protein
MGPVLDGFLGHGLDASLPSRQRRLARSLRASFSGIFRLGELRGQVRIFGDLETGRRIEVYEHDTDLPCAEGSLGIGRLYAFDGQEHLRSPGMALIQTADTATTAELAATFRKVKPQLGTAMATEAVLSAWARPGSLPFTMLPAETPTAATRWVERATAALSAVGRVEDTETAPADADRSSGAGPTPTRRYKVDVPVGQWLSALLDQGDPARPSTPGPDRVRGS